MLGRNIAADADEDQQLHSDMDIFKDALSPKTFDEVGEGPMTTLQRRPSIVANHQSQSRSPPQGRYPPVQFRSELTTLVRAEDEPDIEGFLKRYPNLAEKYIPVSIIGEGTFSTVYKALDVRHYEYDNSAWLGSSRQDLNDPSRLYTVVTAIDDYYQAQQQAKRRRPQNGQVAALAASKINQMLRDWCARRILQRGRRSLASAATLTKSSTTTGDLPPHDETRPIDKEVLRRWLEEEPPHFVAIKRINSTSGPKRIAEELLYLSRLAGRKGVIPVITAERFEDQVLVVFPFFENQDFRVIDPFNEPINQSINH